MSDVESQSVALADERGKHEPAWDRLRELDRSFCRSHVAAFVAFWVVPLSLAAVDYLFDVPHAVGLIYWIPAALAMLVVSALLMRNGWRIRAFRCPRCGNRFYRGTLMSPAGRKCYHCDLFVYQAKD
ncbi:MAG TPA: hypothetical protein VHY91_24490 [Pirellulales bacterium]|jgi:hypothetical protein|nr:hypothetical protein [Pirellulales bacterium]